MHMNTAPKNSLHLFLHPGDRLFEQRGESLRESLEQKQIELLSCTTVDAGDQRFLSSLEHSTPWFFSVSAAN